MKRIFGIGIALGVFLLMPATIPEIVHISYAVPAPVVEVIKPLTILPVAPVRLGFGDRTLKDVVVSVPGYEREVVYLSKYEIKAILAQTSWRSYITGSVIQIEDGSWIQDDSMFEQIYRIVMCESTGRPDAVGDVEMGGSYGLFQINMVWHQLISGRDLFDPIENAQVAYEIWKLSDHSFSQWSCHPTQG